MKQEIVQEAEGMIGLEIHVYLVTREKLFCRCISSREKGLKANVNICPICTGQPGAKPMLPNKTAVEKAVQIGIMLGCKINEKLAWQRKHYDWPDLPKGFQNTLSGKWASPVGVNGKFFGIGVTEMHLEEDPAAWEPDTGAIDYNRSGLPLVEIVTEPDFSTAEEVTDWLKKLLHHLSYLKAADTNAGIKVDVNVSIPDKTERVEIKNISSLESIREAIAYELDRQAKEGNKKRETRRWDDMKGKTVKMRDKESGEDYRFIADPDLKWIVIDRKFVEEMKGKIPQTPEEKLEKLIKKYKLDEYNAEILARNIDIVGFYEKVVEKVDAKFALSWVTVELLRLLNTHQTALDKVDINVEHFIALLRLVKEGKITELQGKQILKQFCPKSFMPSGLAGKITDVKELEKVAKDAIAKNAKAVADYKNGEQKAFDFLMGEIMRATEKRADYKIARDVLGRLVKK